MKKIKKQTKRAKGKKEIRKTKAKKGSKGMKKFWMQREKRKVQAKKSEPEEETAFFGAGCFWNVEEAFRRTRGVKDTSVGYMGGNERKYRKPTYEQVCSDKTGFVEICKVIFNPKKVSYEKLLKIFWKIHNPTEFNRQGPDIGSQYRSAIFYTSPRQHKEAEISKKKEQISKYEKVVTEIKKAGKFCRAEDYHQRYLMKRGLKVCKS